MNNYKLKVRQLDDKLSSIRLLLAEIPEYNSWFQVIREALSMPTRYIAKTMNISSGRVSQLQKGEINGSITLRNLHKLAESLDCKLVYAFIPNQPLETIIENQAKKMATEQINRVAHSMGLEDQATNNQNLKLQYEELVMELKSKNPKKLWKH
jgi:predicted DNA-binding mobile mystery protein A